MSNKIPILAVCYGFQLVAQHFGSSLKKLIMSKKTIY